MTITDKLKATRLTYTFTDESGYKFTVCADLTDDRGWTANVSMSVRGMRDAESAVRYLSAPVRHFLRMLVEPDPDKTAQEIAAWLKEQLFDELAAEVRAGWWRALAIPAEARGERAEGEAE